ncbi:hypothetical protein AVEN_63531-1 [Araneus ventricosus]|uniref:Uncharacterized protein n=1 Tax=Araneus ventricosus TaxID=182803 RepID=A0A4Y2QG43_ARAVE|nr:hypothetical protein AVEN_63531-1 [Araneus ventricosus]
MEFSRIFKRIPFPNRDIEKRIVFSGIIYLPPRSTNLSPSRQNSRQGQGSQNGRCPSLHIYPCKTPSSTIRLASQKSDITSLQQNAFNDRQLSIQERYVMRIFAVEETELVNV